MLLELVVEELEELVELLELLLDELDELELDEVLDEVDELVLEELLDDELLDVLELVDVLLLVVELLFVVVELLFVVVELVEVEVAGGSGSVGLELPLLQPSAVSSSTVTTARIAGPPMSRCRSLFISFYLLLLPRGCGLEGAAAGAPALAPRRRFDHPPPSFDREAAASGTARVAPLARGARGPRGPGTLW